LFDIQDTIAGGLGRPEKDLPAIDSRLTPLPPSACDPEAAAK
jgi:hypothetical protein